MAVKQLLVRRSSGFFFRLRSTHAKEKPVKYTDTVNLPKTKFPQRLGPSKRPEVQAGIIQNHLSQLYSWQREYLKEPEFVLHDGPPYANGSTHVGHAVNKILKDLVLKSHIVEGRKVHYVPGWDCHGLPIELKALSDSLKASPMEVRGKARKFALKALEDQKQDFLSWGVGANWAGNVYKTIDREYVEKQLEVFFELYRKGLIYRDLKPVHWSPSSRTALAEAELEHDRNFVSPSLYFRVKLRRKSEVLQKYGKLYGLIWTTTPWTLLSNAAVCFNPKLVYSVVESEKTKFLVASSLLETLASETGRNFRVLEEIDGKCLFGLTYEHPLLKTELDFLEASHVEESKGTGLVHTAPAHGMEDFLVCLANKIPVECFVNEAGCFSDEAPEHLRGKYVLEEGNRAMLELIKEDVVSLGEVTHSYPIDWRTKKPVIFRASQQWFIDTARIKERAVEEIERIDFHPKAFEKVYRQNFVNQVVKRPYWCISRQRCWGVPIPVFYSDSNEVVVDENMIGDIRKLVSDTGNIDFWWTREPEEILSKATLAKLGGQRLQKGRDILDIWFDSGVSWYCALDSRPADVYLEGIDQLTGWFQSSLMTSVALRNKAPFKAIFAHGFTVDEEGHKMSKSVGNVVAPRDIITKYGVDVLRWWVAAHSVQHSSIPIGDKTLENSAEAVQKVRNTLRFLNGFISAAPQTDSVSTPTRFIDRFVLHTLSEFSEDVSRLNREYQFNSVTRRILNFVTNDLSSFYLHLIKDRLYCGTPEESQEVLRVMQLVYLGCCKTLWPVVPFLVEESWSYCSQESFFKTRVEIPASWRDPELQHMFERVSEAKQRVQQAVHDLNSWTVDVRVESSEENVEVLRRLSQDELCEIFQVQRVELGVSESADWDVSVTKRDQLLCPRCRRFAVATQGEVCGRCRKVLAQKGLQ